MSFVEVTLNLFPKIAVEMPVKARAAEDDTAKAVADGAQNRAPVDTGRLRDSIHAEGNEVVVDATNEEGTPYGVFVEFGTHDHGPAQPFLRPAVEEQALPFEARLATALEV